MLLVLCFSSCKVNETATDHSRVEGRLFIVPIHRFIWQIWKKKIEEDILFVSNRT